MSESDDTIVVFLDSDKELNFCDILNNDYINYITPCNIRYLSADGILSAKTEYFYIWSKNPTVQKAIETFKFAKVLQYSNIIATASTTKGGIKQEVMDTIQTKVLNQEK